MRLEEMDLVGDTDLLKQIVAYLPICLPACRLVPPALPTSPYSSDCREIVAVLLFLFL